VRGDKGIKESGQTSATYYFSRVIKLSASFAHIIVIALLSLLLSQAARLFVPNYQVCAPAAPVASAVHVARAG